MLRLYDFKEKEVVNACDCRKLGHVTDIVFDECSGCIESIVVPKRPLFSDIFNYSGLQKKSAGAEYIIPFQCIRKIGRDIILVEIHEETK